MKGLGECSAERPGIFGKHVCALHGGCCFWHCCGYQSGSLPFLPNFLVDIKGPAMAFLPVLAFEGGTIRNISKFEPGPLISVRVVKANPGTNPELSCTDGVLLVLGRAAEFGPLKEGFMLECITSLSRMLPLLANLFAQFWRNLGRSCLFEI
ncbi:hypothetical protein MLD38_032024 [Melastoma candidum]|uniref:Uncharacterized protein n=1 Tax=Melastoma candidum TaxID=119954 RepID=A0ACB9MS14_9MYRT|nr:hypothetical protein MLD38_032024 [Melastoma candidum]